MNRIKQIFIALLSVILISTVLPINVAYANELTAEAKADYTIEKALIKTERLSTRLALGSMVSVSTYAELTAALEAKIPNIYIINDITLEDTLQIDYNVSFLADNEGVTLFSASNKRHIIITSSDVQIQFNNTILDGGKENDIKGGGIEADDVKNITLINPFIQNCYQDKAASAIYNFLGSYDENAFFYIYNGIIENNYGKTTIDVFSNQILIYNTIIEDNSAPKGYGNGTIALSGDDVNSIASVYNSIIRNNFNSCGAGINLTNTNLVINENTIIENNTAAFGGGIYSNESTIESQAVIKNNSSTQSGGGIWLYDSKFIMNNGEICFNKAQKNGGGISTNNYSKDDESVVINNGILQGNMALNGSAIGYDYMTNLYPDKLKVVVNGGLFCDNGYTFDEEGNLSVKCTDGGAIYGSNVIINGGTFENNLCLNAGGAINAQNLIITDGMIQDNGYYQYNDFRTMSGGGLYVYKNADISGGLIYSNEAQIGGGAVIFGTLTLHSPAYIRYNIATEAGGGVYFCGEKSILDVDFDRIKNNTAPNGAQHYIK